VAEAGERAARRYVEFFTAAIRNPHTRRAYARAAADFLHWCEHEAEVRTLGQVQPLHVAGWIEAQARARSAPTVKQRLAAIRHLFDWLVTGQVVPANPAASVRDPRHSATKGKTPVLEAAEARELLDSIDVTTAAGLRDRALIALMVFSFARVGAALAMRVEDVFVQRRRLWVRLHEKGGKRHEMPCHHTLEEYLHAYIEGTGIEDDPKGPLFRSIGRGTRELTRTPLPQANAYAMIQRRAAAAGIGDADRQPHFPGHGHHRISQERGHARKRGSDGQSRQHPNHPALRPATRRDQPGRSGADQGVSISGSAESGGQATRKSSSGFGRWQLRRVEQEVV
jgi:site-specific recombinase XerD